MNPPAHTTRLDREAAHFDRAYEGQETADLLVSAADVRRYANPPADTIYTKEYFYHLLDPLSARRVLEIACGSGFETCLAAANGALVDAYDISPVAVALARRRAEVNGLADCVRAAVCGTVDEAFPSERYDRVMGYAVLHHLPLAGLGEAIYRRLKPGGRAVFVEPVINSRLLDRVRRTIRYRPCAVTEDEQPLNDRQIAELAQPFDRVRRREFECLSRLYPLFPGRDRLVRALYRIDRWLMRVGPLRRFASVVVFALYRDSGSA